MGDTSFRISISVSHVRVCMYDSILFRLDDIIVIHFILQWYRLTYTGSYYLFVSSQMLQLYHNNGFHFVHTMFGIMGV